MWWLGVALASPTQGVLIGGGASGDVLLPFGDPPRTSATANIEAALTPGSDEGALRVGALVNLGASREGEVFGDHLRVGYGGQLGGIWGAGDASYGTAIAGGGGSVVWADQALGQGWFGRFDLRWGFPIADVAAVEIGPYVAGWSKTEVSPTTAQVGLQLEVLGFIRLWGKEPPPAAAAPVNRAPQADPPATGAPAGGGGPRPDVRQGPAVDRGPDNAPVRGRPGARPGPGTGGAPGATKPGAGAPKPGAGAPKPGAGAPKPGAGAPGAPKAGPKAPGAGPKAPGAGTGPKAPAKQPVAGPKAPAKQPAVGRPGARKPVDEERQKQRAEKRAKRRAARQQAPADGG